MVQTAKASTFFSIKSFFAGFRNNVLGMVGFVKEGRKGKVRRGGALAWLCSLQRTTDGRKPASHAACPPPSAYTSTHFLLRRQTSTTASALRSS